MNETQAPRIEFPCNYPIKVVGDAGPDFRDLVLGVLDHHVLDIDAAEVVERNSRNGRYTSLTITIVATGEPQLKALFIALKNTGRVRMVL